MQPEIDYIKVGQRINQARKENGKMTQDELSARCGCSTSYLSRCENGKAQIALPLLFRIGVATGKDMNYFFMDSPYSDPNIKISRSINCKLQQCSAEMLTVVERMLTDMVDYDQSIRKRLGDQSFDTGS